MRELGPSNKRTCPEPVRPARRHELSEWVPCGKPTGSYKLCEEHRHEKSQQVQDFYKSREDAGFCRFCGERRAPGLMTCLACKGIKQSKDQVAMMFPNYGDNIVTREQLRNMTLEQKRKALKKFIGPDKTISMRRMSGLSPIRPRPHKREKG